MKRDMELIRKILLAIEDSPTGYAPNEIKVEGYTDDQIGYHEYLLVKAGLARGTETTNTGSLSPSVIIMGLTWEGHEFIDASRDEPRWKTAMGIVKEKSGSITMGALKDLLTSLIKVSIGLG
jgi:hypothetical protein